MLAMQKVLSLKDELKKKNPKLEGKFLISEKIDGWYVQIYYSPAFGWCSPVSSSGRTIPSLEWTKEVFNKQFVRPSYPICLIAEAHLEDTPFHITNGMLNRSKGDYHLKEVSFAFHDLIDIQKPIFDAVTRAKLLREFIKQSDTTAIGNWSILPLITETPCNYNYDVWYREFDKIVSAGGEGIVAKRTTGGYSAGKRNTDLIRIKAECTVEAVAMELEYTIGDKGNPGITLISKLANGILVRTVLNKHEDQALFTAQASSMLGNTVVQLKAMEELEDGQLRQPVFQCVRYDKLITDVLK